VDVDRTPLPGIGLQHTFATRKGRRVGVVSHHSGRRDLVIYRRDDPDSASELVVLCPEEASGLAELLGTTRITERLDKLRRQVEGLVTAPVRIPEGSPYAGRPLGDTRIRTLTGASIVAVLRSQEVVASPRPDFTFATGDVVMVVGDEEGTAAATAILTTGKTG
jgi:TrkA domain protein